MNSKNWKTIHTEDKREFICRKLPVNGLSEAFKLTNKLSSILITHTKPEDVSVSIGAQYVMVILHGSSKGTVTQEDIEMSEKIDTSFID